MPSMTPEMLERIRAEAQARTAAVAALAARICEVPSPTGEESQRGAFVASLLAERGYQTETDDVGNVYTRRGRRGGPLLMLLAHIDTVFPAGTPIAVRQEGDTLHGPGIGDNAVNVASMITLLDVLDALGVETPCDLIACADVGEEGLGNLRGARAACQRYRDELGAVLVIDGRQGNITNAGVGSKRWRVTVRGPGGHSFGAFGVPSAIHGLGRIIAAIADIQVPSDPKTTYNVGMIEGGTSINTIAARASALLDMRSVGVPELDQLSARVERIIGTAPDPGLASEIQVVGERPAGSRPLTDPLVQLAISVLRWLGYEPELHASSTDANIPISLGIPAVCVGVARGEGAHTVHEFIEIPSITDGLAQIIRLTIEASDLVAQGVVHPD
ncbi:MAG TPA: M20/M25/M40 family metallo-hydrolase [Thermomicrobiaceae bacterium]|nr:M20/M25/M40 family metallo-hydrolase [Thermomicrobiaceae bacterium]